MPKTDLHGAAVRKILSCALLALSMSGTQAWAQTGLFTEINTNSVFDKARPAADQPSPDGTPADSNAVNRRLPGEEALREMLSIAGYSAKVTDDNQTTVSLQGETWAATLVLELVNDQAELLLTLRLSEKLDAGLLTGERLLKLMQLNNSQKSAYFAIAEEGNRLSLRMSLDNREISVNRLHNSIESLQSLANKNLDAWKFAVADDGKPKGNAEQPQISSEQSVVSPLIGKWIGSRPNEAFALQVNSNGTFQMAVVAQGKNKKTQGNFTVTGEELTLTMTDGTKLVGNFKMTEPGFDLTLKGSADAASKLVFRKAK